MLGNNQRSLSFNLVCVQCVVRLGYLNLLVRSLRILFSLLYYLCTILNDKNCNTYMTSFLVNSEQIQKLAVPTSPTPKRPISGINYEQQRKKCCCFFGTHKNYSTNSLLNIAVINIDLTSIGNCPARPKFTKRTSLFMATYFL